MNAAESAEARLTRLVLTVCATKVVDNDVDDVTYDQERKTANAVHVIVHVAILVHDKTLVDIAVSVFDKVLTIFIVARIIFSMDVMAHSRAQNTAIT